MWLPHRRTRNALPMHTWDPCFRGNATQLEQGYLYMGGDSGCDGMIVAGTCLPTRKVTGICAPLTISVKTFPVFSHRFSCRVPAEGCS